MRSTLWIVPVLLVVGCHLHVLEQAPAEDRYADWRVQVTETVNCLEARTAALDGKGACEHAHHPAE